MIKLITSVAILAASAAVAIGASAAEPSTDAVRAAIQKLTPELAVEQLQSSPVPGLYHVVLGGSSGYVTADGKFFVAGDLFDVQARKNMTEERRKTARLALLAKVDPKETIVFGPEQPRHTVTVFTDVDCGYCRKLHSEIAKYNGLGIAVRYLAFPRSGPGTDSWKKMEAVWCSRNRSDAITKAKLGEAVASKQDCVTTAIAAQYALGDELGVQGTPMMVLADGSVLAGYVPAEHLAQQLALHTSEGSAAKQAP